MDNRIVIFAGHFGSGKTEIALNYAINTARSGKKVTIVDLDIVNTYFRTKDAERQLSAEGVRLIAGEFANTNLDMPTVSSDVLSVFEDREAVVVFDVGGDKDGAFALGMYKRFFEREGYTMYFVVNQRRPLTETAEDMLLYMAEVEYASRLKIFALINNTNLAKETTADIVLVANGEVEKAAKAHGVDVEYIAAAKQLAQELRNDLKQKIFELDLYLERRFLV